MADVKKDVNEIQDNKDKFSYEDGDVQVFETQEEVDKYARETNIKWLGEQ